MRAYADTGLLFWRSLVQTSRNLRWVAVGLSGPILYLLLFTPLLQKFAGSPGFPSSNVLDVFLPGILAFVAFGTGTGLGYSVIFQVQEGLIERLRVTPVNRFALLIGPILADIAWALVFFVAIVAVALPIGFDFHPLGLLVMFVLLALLLALAGAFSITLALVDKDINSFAATMNGIYLPVLLLAGVLLPISLGPAWMGALAHIDPLYYVVEADRKLAAGDIFNGTVGLAFLVMIGLTALTLYWGTRVYRKAVS